jgi:hypothetical protein
VASNKAQALTDVQGAIAKMISAHEAVKQGIATHAEKRRAAQQASRHAAEQQLRIEAGIKAQNADVRTSN